MIIDSLWLFTGGVGGAGNGNGTTDSPTNGTQNSSNIVDVGVTSGVPTSANGGGARDLGIGDDPAMQLVVQVVTAFAAGTSLQVGVQGAPDNGAGAPGAWVTYATGPAVVLASLTAGVRLFDTPLMRPALDQPLPRYYRLTYVTVGTFTGGAIEAFLVLDRNDQAQQAAGVSGGYPVGITVAN